MKSGNRKDISTLDLVGVPAGPESVKYQANWVMFRERGEKLFSSDAHTHIYTPQRLIRRILQQIDTSGNLLALNPEFVYELVYINKKDPSEITLWCPTKAHEDVAKALKCNVIRNLFNRTNSVMKFDVVLMNPPYNDSTSSRKESKHRAQGANLARKFCGIALELSSREMCVIQPYNNKIYSDSLAIQYKQHGLYEIQNVSDSFPVKQVIGAFYFNRQTVVSDIVDEFQVTPALQKSLAQNLVIQAGRLYRKDYEHLLNVSGKYKVIVTTDIIRYTDDYTLIERMKDRSSGKWRVVMGQNGSKTSLGKLILAAPTDTLSYSVSCLAFNTKKEAENCLAYLEHEDTKKFISTVKRGVGNNKRLFQFLPALD